MAIFKLHSQALRLLKHRPSTFLVYAWMSNRARETGANIFHLPLDTIASECSLSRNTAHKALSELVRFGILQYREIPGHPSEYRLIEVGDWNRQPQKVDEPLNSPQKVNELLNPWGLQIYYEH